MPKNLLTVTLPAASRWWITLQTKNSGKRAGYVETLFGGRRPTPDVHSSNFIVRRQTAERQAEHAHTGTRNRPYENGYDSRRQKLPNDCVQLLQIRQHFSECPETRAEEVETFKKKLWKTFTLSLA